MRLVLPMPGNEAFAAGLAQAAGAELGRVETRRFPDGETYVRLLSDPKGRAVDIVCTLADPDANFLRLAFAADAARDLGAASVTLVAPYLAYMRQDRRFHDGEAVTSRSFARLASSTFDRLVTVDPHLHRYRELASIYTIPAEALHAAPLFSAWIREHAPDALVVGPDAESEQWAAEVARGAGVPHVAMVKERLGDRQVRVSLPNLSANAGRRPVLIDDIASSGRTLVAAARALRAQGFAPPDCLVVHALFAEGAYEEVAAVTDRIVSTDSVPHVSSGIGLTGLMAAVLTA